MWRQVLPRGSSVRAQSLRILGCDGCAAEAKKPAPSEPALMEFPLRRSQVSGGALQALHDRAVDLDQRIHRGALAQDILGIPRHP